MLDLRLSGPRDAARRRPGPRGITFVRRVRAHRGADNMSVIIVLFKKYGRVDSFWSRLWGRFSG